MNTAGRKDRGSTAVDRSACCQLCSDIVHSQLRGSLPSQPCASTFCLHSNATIPRHQCDSLGLILHLSSVLCIIVNEMIACTATIGSGGGYQFDQPTAFSTHSMSIAWHQDRSNGGLMEGPRLDHVPHRHRPGRFLRAAGSGAGCGAVRGGARPERRPGRDRHQEVRQGGEDPWRLPGRLPRPSWRHVQQGTLPPPPSPPSLKCCVRPQSASPVSNNLVGLIPHTPHSRQDPPQSLDQTFCRLVCFRALSSLESAGLI